MMGEIWACSSINNDHVNNIILLLYMLPMGETK